MFIWFFSALLFITLMVLASILSMKFGKFYLGTSGKTRALNGKISFMFATASLSFGIAMITSWGAYTIEELLITSILFIGVVPFFDHVI